MFAQLGEHIFQGLKTPTALSETNSVRYGRIPLVNGKDVLQFTGEELSESKITVQYLASFCSPDIEIESLRKSMRAAEVLPFIMGDGKIIGKFVITDIAVDKRKFLPSGELEDAIVNISLLEKSGGEELAPSGLAVKDTTATTGDTVPAAEPPADPVPNTAKSVTDDISKAKSKVDAIKEIGRKVKDKTSSYKRKMRDVRRLADDARQAYSSAKTKVEVAKKIAKRATQLPTSLDEAMQYAENLAKIDDVADMSVMKMGIDNLSESADKVTTHAAPVTSMSATKEGDE